MKLHPMHPARWVVETLQSQGWLIESLLAFTRASTLLLVRRGDNAPLVVLKAGFGSNHVLATLPAEDRGAAYGFYWYNQMTAEELDLARSDFLAELKTAEAATAAAHVVPLLASGTAGDFDWYTMPYYPEGNFRSHIVPASPDSRSHFEGLRILADTAAGLHALHELGIVHRDVYQENILISQGRGYITDLGASRHLTDARGPISKSPEVHWPPEYRTAYNTAGPEADVFSLAVLVHRLVCGDLPRWDSREARHRLPLALANTLPQALTADPRARPSMPELGTALAQAAAEPPEPGDTKRY